MKYLAMIGILFFVAGCAAEYNKLDTDNGIGTRTHHCQQYSDGTANCVSWVNGKYNNSYHNNCNEITCK